jgi:hypothetical protein
MKLFGFQKSLCFANNDHNATLYIVDEKSINVKVTQTHTDYLFLVCVRWHHFELTLSVHLSFI